MSLESNIKQFFISYSHLDNEIVEPVAKLLMATGTELFFDKYKIQPGKKWKLVLIESINSADVVIVFWSQNSSNSNEVKKEWQQGIDNGKDILPILLDSTLLSSELQEYQYIDFQSIIRVGHPWEEILKELAELIALKITENTEQNEDTWWTALFERWRKKK